VSNKPVNIVIIEDHPLMRDGLASWFSGKDRWKVAGTAGSLAEAKKLLPHTKADLVLIDIQLEDGWGLDIIPLFAHNKDRPLMAVYSSFDDYAHVGAALNLGVRAYICKRRGAAELEQALLKVLDGETIIDELVQTRLAPVNTIFNLLTKREGTILKMIINGLANKQIAEELGISLRTVENAVSSIYDKSGIQSRQELQKL